MRIGCTVLGGVPTVLVSISGAWRRLNSLDDRESAASALELIANPLTGSEIAALSGSEKVAAPDRWLPPIGAPPKNVICVGKNYAAHVEEGAKAEGTGVEIPAAPVFFTKPPTSLVGSGTAIDVPSSHRKALDYEGELCVVIGKACRRISESDALDCVFGYTIINDLTARDIQQSRGQWFFGKGFDGAAPCGPWIVTADELPDPQQVSIRTTVNSELRQSGSSSSMIFPVREIISTLSSAITLQPGDLIATGTPSGVAWGMDMPRYLGHDDRVSVAIDGIGELWNTIRFS